ncbi:MAG: DUF3800 domain-containing protein [Candidatus Omnitrophica bacterium]|nr:DUF3800 domain-containing protein [Candidatus Omnitrophota bacterium]
MLYNKSMKKQKNHKKIIKKPDYYFYIDDSGSRYPDKQNFIDRNDGMDNFALGGVLIAEKDKKMIKEKYEDFCNKWDIDYALHSSDIRGMRNDFAWLEESTKNKEKFLTELEEFLISLPVIGFASVIYRPGYNERYKEKYGDKRWWMCKTAYTILIERTTKYLKKTDSTMFVRFEEAGKKEDRAIFEYAKNMKNIGHPFSSETSEKYNTLDKDDYKKVILGEPKRKKKWNLFIQIADIYLYPMVKRRYDSEYRPWKVFYKQGKVIDAYLPENSLEIEGIKYSCFENFKIESKKPKQA